MKRRLSEAVPRSDQGIWVHGDHLPVLPAESRVTLGEGSTPMLSLQNTSELFFQGIPLWAKAEHMNPTGSFKDRIAPLAASLAKRDGRRFILGTSSGNGGASVAAYGTRVGIPVVILTSPNAASAKLTQIRAVGGDVIHVEGMGTGPDVLDDLIPIVHDVCDAHDGMPFLTGFRYMPDAMTGVATIWSEIVADVGEPSAVYVPVGGGGLITGIHLGLRKTASGTRLVGVQPEGCATLLAALNGRPGRVQSVGTGISGLQVARLFDESGAVRAVLETQGRVVTVSDQHIRDVQTHLARTEGVLVEPAGAVALAGAIAEARAGLIGPDDVVVVMLTGAAHKDAPSLDALGSANSPRVDLGSIDATVVELLEG